MATPDIMLTSSASISQGFSLQYIAFIEECQMVSYICNFLRIDLETHCKNIYKNETDDICAVFFKLPSECAGNPLTHICKSSF